MARKNRYVWEKLKKWHDGNYRDFPWRRNHVCPWGVLLAEMLLRRTDSPTVASIFPVIYSKYPSPSSILSAPKGELIEHIKPLGLWQQRAEALIQISEALVQRHSGTVPQNLDDLKSLPHIGEYAAGAVMVFAYGHRAPMPDINIIRIISRYLHFPYYSKSQNKKIALKALEFCPKGREKQFFYALLDLGSLHCKSRPNCTGCPLERKCLSRQGVFIYT